MVRNESMPEWNELQKLIDENLPTGTQYVVLINEPGKEDMINLVNVDSKQNAFNMALTFAADVTSHPSIFTECFNYAIRYAKETIDKIKRS